VGVERILRFRDRSSIPATFFVTGYTADTYPDSVRVIALAGYEIGITATSTRTPGPLAPRTRNGTFWNKDLPPWSE